jgi:acetyltransferase
MTDTVVNPHHVAVLGVASVASPVDLPPAPVRVPLVVRECGVRGAHAVLLLRAGFGESGPIGQALQDDVTSIIRTDGLRLAGPNCIGVVNTDPSVIRLARPTPHPDPLVRQLRAVPHQKGN